MLFEPLSRFCDFSLDGSGVDLNGPTGNGNYFVLAGVSEFFDDHEDMPPGTSVDRLLMSLIGPFDLPQNWLDCITFEGTSDSLEKKKQIFSKIALKQALQKLGHPKPHMSFANSLGVLLHLASYLQRHTDTLNRPDVNIEIRYSGCYLDGFAEVFLSMSPEERFLLHQNTGQLLLTLEQMAFARPVTKHTAEKVKTEMLETEVGKRHHSGLSIGMYKKRTEISDHQKRLMEEHESLYTSFFAHKGIDLDTRQGKLRFQKTYSGKKSASHEKVFREHP